MGKTIRKDWFTEKPYQVDICSFRAFGIEIMSRHGKAREVVEMLRFCEALAKDGLNDFVENCFYDGNADLCQIIFEDEENEEGCAARQFKPQIIAIAEEYITQFQIDGHIGHGKFVSEF